MLDIKGQVVQICLISGGKLPSSEADCPSGSAPRAAAMTLRTVLLSLQALLAAAEPDDPQDAVVANQVREAARVSF